MMKRSKINKKACNNCGLEAAVARKVCGGCNTPFYSKRPTYYYEVKDNSKPESENVSSCDPSTSASTIPSQQSLEDNGRRRTERVKREKPHFYDASEFEHKHKKKSDKNAKVSNKPNKTLPAQLKKKEKKRLNELKLKESLAEAEDEHLYESIMTPRKSEHLSIILEELNHKLIISAWKPC